MFTFLMEYCQKKPHPVLPENLVIGERRVSLTVRETLRAQRMTLRLHSTKADQVILTVPPKTSRKVMVGFIERSLPWLEKQHARAVSPVNYTHGMILPVLGKKYELRHKVSRSFRAWWGEGYLLVHAPAEKLGMCVHKTLHQVALQFLQEQTLGYAAKIGMAVKGIALRDTRSRWGSCSANGNISYSWRLVFAPRAVAGYVCAHEVAHLLEMNHSPQFWQVVEKLCPDFKPLRQWLRQNGKTLFQYKH